MRQGELDKALEVLIRGRPRRQVFRFGPVGEPPVHAEVLSIEEPARLLRENRIARCTAHHVHWR